MPLAVEKNERLVTALAFLGICVDTVAGELRLPDSKLERLKVLLRDWGNKIVCRRKELESLISLLNHACKVVRPGRSFIRHLIDLLHQTGSRPSGDSWIILRDVEREILSPTNSFSTNSGAHDRFIRDLGLWCMVQAELVSGFVGPPCG